LKEHDFRLISVKKKAHRDPLLRSVGLGKIFPMGNHFIKVLENINLSVNSGELVCILGPSGCGKTTLLKIVAGFIKPSSGRIETHGVPISGPGFERCIVFQEDALFPWLTVEENIAFGLKGRINKREIKKRVGKFLYLTGLEGFGRYLPSEISGGMKQRVALARVLVLDPKLLLMDEPFGSLDAQSREEMQSLLLSLWEELRHTIIFVTHDITEAAFLADRILVMDKYPGSIKLIVDVSLKRPRRKETNEFHHFYRYLRDRIGLNSSPSL